MFHKADAVAEARKLLLDVANNRSGTNVAKCILAYEEQPELFALVALLEEISKNTDYSTNLNVSLPYLLDEYLRHCSSSGDVGIKRSTIVAAGHLLQYCGKIYGDRVEFVYQTVEHQLEMLRSAEAPREKEANNNSNNNNNGSNADKPEEPKKRRMKKLTNQEVDPYAIVLEPRRFKTMMSEKRFSSVGFAKCQRNRTIEYLYLDHTLPNIWQHAPIVQPNNPYETDEKKHYKLFNYHVEHRYNTLLPDIPFERLNLIKEYVHTHQVNVAGLLNEHMTTRDYLNEYIALENQVLKSRYGATSRSSLKRKDSPNAVVDSFLKRLRKDSTEDANNTLPVTDDSALGESLNQSSVMESTRLGESLENRDSNTTLPLTDSGLGESLLSSTLNQSSVVESTRLGESLEKKDATELQQQDSGIFMDETPGPGQNFDDEGVVLSELDILLSPRVVVQDILPGVPNKSNLTILVDDEMLRMLELKSNPKKASTVNLEEIISVPRIFQCAIDINILQLKTSKLRRQCFFRLTKEFDTFKQTRLPIKTEKEPKPRPVPRTIAFPPAQERSPLMEFNENGDFLGFNNDDLAMPSQGQEKGRRSTNDSGFSHEQQAANDASFEQADEVDIINVPIEEARDAAAINQEMQETAMMIDMQQLDKSVNATDDAALAKETTNCELPEPAALAPTDDAIDEGMEMSQAELPSAIEELDDSSTSPEEAEDAYKSVVDSSEMIRDWHMRLTPALEAAHERQNFDIKDLGTEIIESCQAGSGRTSLANVMEDKEPSTMCRYFLASLLLANQGNVALNFGERNQDKPIKMSSFKMDLLTTKRMEVHPEDDVGNAIKQSAVITKAVTAVKRKLEQPMAAPAQVNLKAVRLIAPIPKLNDRPEEADSGISSLTASQSSSSWNI